MKWPVQFEFCLIPSHSRRYNDCFAYRGVHEHFWRLFKTLQETQHLYVWVPLFKAVIEKNIWRGTSPSVKSTARMCELKCRFASLQGHNFRQENMCLITLRFYKWTYVQKRNCETLNNAFLKTRSSHLSEATSSSRTGSPIPLFEQLWLLAGD